MPTNQSRSALLKGAYSEESVAAAAATARESMGANVDCIFAFVSPSWQPHLDEMVEVLQIEGRCPAVTGSSAHGIIHDAEEHEESEGASFLFLSLPNTEVKVEAIGDKHPHSTSRPELSGAISLLNPFETDVSGWVDRWNDTQARTPCFGGLASGGNSPEHLFTFANGHSGTVPGAVTTFTGGVSISGVVSQGCRPFGEPYTITEADGNVIMGIGSQRAYDVLENAFGSLSDADRAIANGNILAGLVMDEYQEEFGDGDFLISSILGGDPDAGALAVGTYAKVGQTLQFQLRDRNSADLDLRHRLTQEAERGESDPFASLLFTCTGRGERMFESPHHDAEMLSDFFANSPTAGFFANGELGPVAGKLFTHGFTASAALFRDA